MTAAAAAATSAAVALRPLLFDDCAEAVHDLARVARALFRDCADVARIGETEQARGAARKLGVQARRWSRLASRGPSRELVRTVETDIRRDFATGHVTTVDGWLLSNGELGLAHACACE